MYNNKRNEMRKNISFNRNTTKEKLRENSYNILWFMADIIML